MMDAERLLERFLRYVRIDTTAVENSGKYPSSPGQRELSSLLVSELRTLGVQDVEQNAHSIVMATLPGNRNAPCIAFNSHVDTSPETTGAGVKPQVVRSYAGGDIALPGHPSRVIRVADNPELAELLGKTIITTDGTTLLGADDKAGVAVIMELAHVLVSQPEIPRGPVKLLFTCDEEIGHGIDHVDLDRLGAVAAYTLDGPAAGQLDVETFSADLATVTFHGINIHPSIAKDRMVNAIRAAAAFVAQLPQLTLAPERTAGRDGFLHPYRLSGGVDEVSLKILLRDFETSQLDVYAASLRQQAQAIEEQFPGCRIVVDVHPQYRNMREGLAREPRAVAYACEAHARLGRSVQQTIVRGGTDGSQLTARGLPTPNLSTGQHNPHSPLEWACLEEMVQAVEVILEIVKRWGEDAEPAPGRT
jgi:tripeptide aminopeptidase